MMAVRETRPRFPSVSVSDVGLAALALFVFSIPYENGITISGVGSLARIIGVVALGAVVLTVIDGRFVRLRQAAAFLVLAAIYVTWALATYFWSVAPEATITRSATLLQLAAMLWMLHQIGNTERNRDVIAQAFVLGAYSSIAVALAAYYGGAGWRDVGGLNPNWFAIGCSFAVPIAWGLAIKARRPVFFWVNALYPAFAVFAVVLSASRGGFVTLLVALTVIPVSLVRLGLARQLVVFVLVVGAAFGTFVSAPQVFTGLEANIERLQGTVDEIEAGTLTGRTIIWDAGVEAFLASPFVGHGYATFNRVVAPILGQGRSAHNAYLSVAVGSGVIGLALFLALIVVVTIGVVASPERRLEFLVIVATVVVAMVPANLENNKSVWFLLGWLAAARPLLIVHHVMHPRSHTEPLIVRRPAVTKAMGVTDADARTND